MRTTEPSTESDLAIAPGSVVVQVLATHGRQLRPEQSGDDAASFADLLGRPSIAADRRRGAWLRVGCDLVFVDR